MPMDSRLLQRGVTLWKSGARESARAVFKAVIRNQPGDENAWFWYIYSLESDAEKITALEAFLDIQPANQKARRAFENLRSRQKLADVEQPNPVITIVAEQSRRSAPVSAETIQRPAQRSPVVSKRTALALPWTLVIVGVICLVCSSAVFLFNQNSLQANYDAEKQARQKLADQYSVLDSDYQLLNAKYENLHLEYLSAVDEYDALLSQYNSLTGEYSNLSNDFDTLNNIAVKPPYIVVHDRMVDTTFYDMDGQLITWTTPFEGFEYSYERGVYMRNLIVDEELTTSLVYTHNNQGVWLRYFSLFLEPEIFTNVIPDLYQRSSNPFDFIYRIWYMIGQLSNYASEDIETPRYPLETLLAGGGDCEDLSILFASLIQAAPVDWYVDLVYVDSENINDPQTSDHVVVYIDTWQGTYVVETTSDTVMLPYLDGVTGWPASQLQSESEIIFPEHFR